MPGAGWRAEPSNPNAVFPRLGAANGESPHLRKPNRTLSVPSVPGLQALLQRELATWWSSPPLAKPPLSPQHQRVPEPRGPDPAGRHLFNNGLRPSGLRWGWESELEFAPFGVFCHQGRLGNKASTKRPDQRFARKNAQAFCQTTLEWPVLRPRGHRAGCGAQAASPPQDLRPGQDGSSDRVDARPRRPATPEGAGTARRKSPDTEVASRLPRSQARRTRAAAGAGAGARGGLRWAEGRGGSSFCAAKMAEPGRRQKQARSSRLKPPPSFIAPLTGSCARRALRLGQVPEQVHGGGPAPHPEGAGAISHRGPGFNIQALNSK
jgi:hypothetical protein